MADKVAAQKAALEIVVGFLVEGLPNEFGATMVDILATTATARMSRRSRSEEHTSELQSQR